MTPSPNSPPAVAAGHQPGDDPGLVGRAGGGAFRFGGRHPRVHQRIYGHAISDSLFVARSQTAVSAAITTANEDPNRWETAVDQDGSEIERHRQTA